MIGEPIYSYWGKIKNRNRKKKCENFEGLQQWLSATSNPLSRFILYQPEHDKNRRGYRRMIYVKYIENIIQKTAEEVWILALDREKWRRFTVRLHDPHTPI